MRKRVACVLLVPVVMCGTSWSAGRADEPPSEAGLSAAAAIPPHRVPASNSPVKVDGVLDEPAWQGALKLELPFEVNPGENIQAQATTQAFLTYDAEHVYVAFRCNDPDPGAIRARLSDRDRAFQDDFVGIVVDTFNDRRRAFEFFVNPLGVQMDLVQDDVAGNEDDSWDAIWDSAAHVTEGGYEVEMAIPYTSLRFQRGAAEQVWGLDLVRSHPRERRRLYALQKRDRNVNCYVCQFQRIVGFADAEPGRNLEVTPTMTAIRTDAAENVPGELEAGRPDYDFGVTARWGITPNLTAAGTINPDFSQVEADTAQLGVNEQFALFFPEKRPFFLEGADFFETPLQAVYTRTVADPQWGTKLTGKEGRHAIGGFVTRDDRLNLLLPGTQSSSVETLEDEPVTDAVLRYRLDMGKNSTVGGLFTAREAEGYFNRVAGVDTLVRFTDKDTLRGQFMASQTSDPIALGLDPATHVDRAGYANYRHSTRTWNASARYQEIGPQFRADMGFLPQVGVRMPVIGAGRAWIGDPNTWYTRIDTGGDYDETVDFRGNLIEREWEGWGQVQGPMQSLVFVGGGARLFGFRDEQFHQTFVNWFMEFKPTALLWAYVDGGISHRVDFAFQDPLDAGAARQGDEVRLTGFGRLNLGRRIRLELSHTLRTLDNSDGYLFRANLAQLNLVYQLSLRAFFRAIVQHTDVRFNLDQYEAQCTADPGTCPLERSRDVFTQLLFSYKLNPQSVLFVGYSDARAGQFPPVTGIEDDSLQPQERTFFTKVGYAWVF
jgi:hypothetical protein